jgi:hypothetical protein
MPDRREETGKMPSISWQTWSTSRTADLDEIENAHRSVVGTGRDRRVATQQINQAYAVLLSSQFQAFCRDLHTEGAKALVARSFDHALGKHLRHLTGMVPW